MCNNCKEELNNELKDYINIQTGEKLDLEKVSTLPDNAMLKVRPDLWYTWDLEKNKDIDIWKITKSSGKKVWWICEKGHEWEAKVSNRNRGKGCPYCNGVKVWKGFNDMWTTNPELASMLANPEDGYKYSQSSNVKLNWKCLSCNTIISNKPANDIKNQGLPCSVCDKNKSFPERVMKNILTSLNIDFVHEKTFKWSKGKRYDFYIPSLNLIIEMHGEQHYSRAFKNISNKTLEEVQLNDEFKRRNALKNNIDKYIVIDSRRSDLSFIKNNIISSELSTILDFNKINWNQIYLKSLRHYKLDILEMWENGFDRDEICKVLNLKRTLVVEYLKEFFKLGICEYDALRMKPQRYKEVMQYDLNNNLIRQWRYSKIAAEELGLEQRKIQECCREERVEYNGFIWKYKL